MVPRPLDNSHRHPTCREDAARDGAGDATSDVRHTLFLAHDRALHGPMGLVLTSVESSLAIIKHHDHTQATTTTPRPHTHTYTPSHHHTPPPPPPHTHTHTHTHTHMDGLVVFAAAALAVLVVYLLFANFGVQSADMARHFAGKVVWITGSSSGLGEGAPRIMSRA